MKFEASKAAEPFEWDFRPHVDAHGYVPEPNDTQVNTFYAAMGKQLTAMLPEERLAGVDMDDPDEVGRLLRTLDAEDHGAMSDALTKIHADVCSDSPTLEQLAGLPPRLRLVFYGLLQGWLRPEAGKSATKQ